MRPCCISAEDGAVEYDLPILENHEVISRYGFPDLALVETHRGKALPDYSIKVTLPDGTFTVLQVCTGLLPLLFLTLQQFLQVA